MQKTPPGQSAPNPHWIAFWRQIRAAADELRRIEAEQAEDSRP